MFLNFNYWKQNPKCFHVQSGDRPLTTIYKASLSTEHFTLVVLYSYVFCVDLTTIRFFSTQATLTDSCLLVGLCIYW